MLHKLKSVLSLKTTSTFILIIAILGRLIQVLFFFNFRSDRSYQILATRNLLEGHGVTIAKVLPSDLSTIVYHPIVEWPPGYSFFAVPFYMLFRHNYMLAGLLLDMVASVLLLLSSRSILTTLGASTVIKNLYTVLAGFFIYEFLFKSSSDLLAITFFIIAIQGFLLIVKGSRFSSIYGVGISLCLLSSGAIKYMFIPIAPIVPIFLLFKSFIDKNGALKKTGIIMLFTTLIGLFFIVIYQKYTTGSAAKLYGSEYGFFPENLLDAYPFIPASFLKPDTLTLITRNELFNKIVSDAFRWLNILMLFGIIWLIIKWFKKKGIRNISLQTVFLCLSVFISAAVLFLLAFLSVKLHKVLEVNSFWIYIQEPRLFGLITVLIQLSFFILWHYKQTPSFKKFTTFFYFLALLLIIETSRGIFFDFLRMKKFGKEEYSWKYEDRLQKHANGIIKSLRDKVGINNVVLTSSHFYISNRISMYSHVPILYDVGRINQINALHSKKPLFLLVAILKEQMSQFQQFLSLHEKNKIAVYDDLSFYVVSVPN